jgi:hypothetical protein
MDNPFSYTVVNGLARVYVWDGDKGDHVLHHKENQLNKGNVFDISDRVDQLNSDYHILKMGNSNVN